MLAMFLSLVTIPWGDKDAIVSEMNSFVKNVARRLLELKQHDSLFQWIGGIFVTVGIAVIAF
jgi:hypothetical protein